MLKKNKTFSITDWLCDKLAQENNASALICELLENYYEKEAPIQQKVEVSEQEIKEQREKLKDLKELRRIQNQIGDTRVFFEGKGIIFPSDFAFEAFSKIIQDPFPLPDLMKWAKTYKINKNGSFCFDMLNVLQEKTK